MTSVVSWIGHQDDLYNQKKWWTGRRCGVWCLGVKDCIYMKGLSTSHRLRC